MASATNYARVLTGVVKTSLALWEKDVGQTFLDEDETSPKQIGLVVLDLLVDPDTGVLRYVAYAAYAHLFFLRDSGGITSHLHWQHFLLHLRGVLDGEFLSGGSVSEGQVMNLIRDIRMELSRHLGGK